jgi:hypothetical protein
MQRSSETIGTIAAALAKAQAPARQSGKVADWDYPLPRDWRSGTVVSLCAALKRTRYCAQDLKPA